MIRMTQKRKYAILFICSLFFSGAVAFANASELKVGDKLDEGGMSYTRENGDKLNLRLVDKQFQLFFVDSGNILLEPDSSKAIVGYTNRRGDDERRTVVLKPVADKVYLTSARKIQPPYLYEIRLILVTEEDGEEQKEVFKMQLLNKMGK